MKISAKQLKITSQIIMIAGLFLAAVAESTLRYIGIGVVLIGMIMMGPRIKEK